MATQAMAISKTGVNLIKRFEGFRTDAARLPDGRFVVGYGHIRSNDPGGIFTEAQASRALTEDLAPIEAVLNNLVMAPLTQNQYDALASFTFSIGVDAFKRSDVLRRLNAGEPIAAACAMDAWRKSSAMGELQVIDHLVRRRAAEKALFLDSDALPNAPSAFLRPAIDHAQAVLSAAPIADTPDIDKPAALSSAPVEPALEEAEKLLAILESDPATAGVLSAKPNVDYADVGDVLELTERVAQTETEALTTPKAPEVAPTNPTVAARQDASEAGAFVLISLIGLVLIGIGAWALFTHGEAGQTWFLAFGSGGIVVTAIAGYYFAKAKMGRSGRGDLQTPALA